MEQDMIFEPSADLAKSALIDANGYAALYQDSIANPDQFWAEHGKRIDWIKPYSQISDVSYDAKDLHIKWYADGTLNAAANCLDRHLATRGDQTAIIWEGDEPDQHRHITYRELHEEVCKFANVLKANGAQKGDRITIYMPMIPEATVAMLACVRIGAVHSVVFGGFSPDALAGRIQDCDSTMVITADEGVRGGRPIPLKAKTDDALANCPDCKTAIVVKRTGGKIDWVDGRDVWYHEAMASASADCPVEEMNAEDPMFILYTSGSTGKQKGVLHTTGGYIVYASHTHELVFDYNKDDVYWCTADIGWITGHSYIVYGPLSNAATQVIFEGVPNYPDFGRFWQIVEQHQVNVFYTAPTALRALMKEGDSWVSKYDLSSLKVLGTVGEPIKSPEWHWYFNTIGNENCPIVDTWWQTETGGILMSPIPGCVPTKPGSATLPLPGIVPAILDEEGNEITERNTTGFLVMTQSWPGQMRSVYGDHQRFIDTYFSQAPGNYFTGDGAYIDDDGYFWITGRVDDVLNVSGHRIGTAEVEGAIGEASGVAEAAVIGYTHEIKGEGIDAFVTLMTGIESSEAIKKDILDTVTKIIGPHAKPSAIQFCSGLPKTRSGKIMRRILKKIAQNETDDLGDTSTLADPSVIDSLL